MKSKKIKPEQIMKILRKHSKDMNKFKVKRIGLFGSFLKGNTNNKSDIDFLVDFNQLTFDNYIELKFFLEKIFHKKIDLVLEKSLKPKLNYIKKEAIYA